MKAFGNCVIKKNYTMCRIIIIIIISVNNPIYNSNKTCSFYLVFFFILLYNQEKNSLKFLGSVQSYCSIHCGKDLLQINVNRSRFTWC